MVECRYKKKCIELDMYGKTCTEEVECGLKSIFKKFEKKEK